MDFVRYVREKMNPLEPIPSGVEPKLRALGGIRAVIFDIYGTLLISGAGDNSLISEQKSVSAMKNAISELPGSESVSANEVMQRYTLLIREHQERRRHEGIQFPEIEIREVWKDLFSEFFSDQISNEILEQVARSYEYEVTECWEMPRAGDVEPTGPSRHAALTRIADAGRCENRGGSFLPRLQVCGGYAAGGPESDASPSSHLSQPAPSDQKEARPTRPFSAARSPCGRRNRIPTCHVEIAVA